MKSFKERCVELRQKDKSIGEIMSITGRSRTSVYYHIRDMPLSAFRIAQYHAAAAQHIRKYAIARKGKSKRPFGKFTTWTPTHCLLLAHLIFDGEILRGRCVYNNRSIFLLRRVMKLMRLFYAFPPARRKNPVTGVSKISYYNVALASYLREKAVELLTTAHAMPVANKKEIVRAFFDDEGCMDFRPKENRRSIRGYQKDRTILNMIHTLLLDLGIESRIVLPNEIVISGRNNLEAFRSKVNFSREIYMNGNRSNSRWNEHVEKRALLDKALASYKT